MRRDCVFGGFFFLVSVSETPVIMCNYLLCRKLVLKDVEPTLCS